MEKLKVILCCVALFAALGYAGRSDWSDQVIGAMPLSAYNEISQKLGDRCTEYDIAKEYMKNKAYYDALSY